jgi:hypothetical protein
MEMVKQKTWITIILETSVLEKVAQNYNIKKIDLYINYYIIYIN